MIKTNKALQIAAILVVTSSGCAGLHGYKDLTVPEIKQKSPDINTARQVSWLIREILPPKAGRQAFDKAMGTFVHDNTSQNRHWTSLAAGSLASLSTGQAFSSAGGHAFAEVGLGVTVIGALTSGHGQYYKAYSRVYLDAPANSSTEAATMAREDMINRIKKAAKDSKLEAQCVINCNNDQTDLWRSYRLIGASEPLWVSVKMGNEMEKTIDPLRDGILGFNATWQSGMDPVAHASTTHGLVITRKEPHADFDKGHFGAMEEIAFDNPAALAFLRSMSGDGRWAFAWQFGGRQQVAAWNGKVYQYTRQFSSLTGDGSSLIDYEILE